MDAPLGQEVNCPARRLDCPQSPDLISPVRRTHDPDRERWSSRLRSTSSTTDCADASSSASSPEGGREKTTRGPRHTTPQLAHLDMPEAMSYTPARRLHCGQTYGCRPGP